MSPSAVDREDRRRRLRLILESHLSDLGELPPPQGEAALPSGRAWAAFVHTGDPSALGSALTHSGLRAGLIAAGLLVVGSNRDRLIRDAIAGSLGVDAFIILWSLYHK